MGEEPCFIDLIEKELNKTVLYEEDRSFNQTILYGKDTTIEQIVDAAKRFPMMAEHQLVIVREAQELSHVIHQLESYVEILNPQPFWWCATSIKCLINEKNFTSHCKVNRYCLRAKSFMKIRCQIG